MTRIQHLLSTERILPSLEAREHWPAITELVDHLVQLGKLEEQQQAEALQALQQREQLHSTSIGSGVAVPHAFLDSLGSTQVVFARSENGVAFDAIDHAPVRFLFLFLVPRAEHRNHLKTLAEVARTLAACSIRRELLAAKNAQEILSILTEEVNSLPR